jgi:hypothetical protein
MTSMTTRLLLTVLLYLGTLGGSAGHETQAHFTTVTQSTSNGFSAGTLHIGKSLASGTTLTMGNLLAGDSFDAQLDIANSGSLDLIYALTTTWTGSDDLANAVQLTIRIKTPAVACSDHVLSVGTTLYSGNLAAAAIGNPAHGPDLGDRALAASTTESLCFAIVLPTSAPASLSNTNVAPTFVFSAEQT